jgi:uncharacterized RDD family membrane protein YckC
VKCPKCSYLGFETGDRCKNCGYDFSLMADGGPERIDIDLDLRETGLAGPSDWLAQVDAQLPSSEPATPPVELRSTLAPDPAIAPDPASAVRSEPADTEKLPLFVPALDDGGDEPLIKVPPTPRPPLAVRRTPDTPRLRAVTTPARRVEPEPTLQFETDGGGVPELRQTPAAVEPPPIARPRVSRVWREPVRRPDAAVPGEVSAPGARAAAAAIDHLMLGGIDLAVVYFTLRMAGLPMDQWTALPPVPLIAFLLFIKLSYFCAFTAVGGQTIGKMVARIRVVSADDHPIDAALALRRTLAGVLSAALLGLGFLPALLGSDRRALHDRLARTRVIALPSA